MRAAPIRGALLVAIVLLYAVSIPWYRAAGSRPEVWLGLPDWVAVALVCYGLVAVLNAFAWLLTDVRDESPRDESDRRSEGR